METKYHNTAGCFLTRKSMKDYSTEILLIYKKWSDDNQGWVPPKGHIEEGETLEQTAIRETQEETGYQNVKIIHPLKTLHIQYPWNDGFLHDKYIHYFLAELLDNAKGELKLSASESSSTVKQIWFTLDDAYDKLKFDDEREIMQDVLKYYKNTK